MKKSYIWTLVLIVCAIGIGIALHFLGGGNEGLMAENVISTDREALFLKHGGNVGWYETDIVFTTTIDSCKADTKIASVTNYFQYVNYVPDPVSKKDSVQTIVYLMQHSADGANYIDPHEDTFMLDDYPLNDEPITITFRQALKIALSSTYDKPHGKHCVLRKELGPVECNPQYVFGNSQGQLYVDAVTGEVSDYNPAYKEKQ